MVLPYANGSDTQDRQCGPYRCSQAPIRDRLGLRAGADLEITETADGIVLKPVEDQPPMERVNGLWVHQGSAPAGLDWDRFVDEEREAHSRRIFGS